VRVLPPGTIVLDKVVFPSASDSNQDEVLYGIITQELQRPSARDNRRGGEQQQQHQEGADSFSGRICVVRSKDEIDVETLALIYTNHIDVPGTGGALATSLSKSSAAVSGATDPGAAVTSEIVSATEAGAVVCYGQRGLIRPAGAEREKGAKNAITRARAGDLVSFVLGSELSTGALHALQVTVIRTAKSLQADIVNRQIKALKEKEKEGESSGTGRVRGEVVALFGTIGDESSARSMGRSPKGGAQQSSSKDGLIRMVGAPTKIAFEFSQVPEENRPLAAPAPAAVPVESHRGSASNWRSGGGPTASPSRFANEWKRNVGEPDAAAAGAGATGDNDDDMRIKVRSSPSCVLAGDVVQ
jgi:hypothetical protein